MPLSTYGTQFRTIPGETETFNSISPTGGVVFVDVKVDGIVISGPIVTLTSITPGPGAPPAYYTYLFTFTGKYCTDIATNNTFIGYNSVNKTTHTYSSASGGESLYATFENDVGTVFDKLISFQPDMSDEKTAIYTFLVDGAPTTRSQKIHLIPTRWYERLQFICNQLHSGRNMADGSGSTINPIGYYTSDPAGWVIPSNC
jgi:hypothetical protein